MLSYKIDIKNKKESKVEKNSEPNNRRKCYFIEKTFQTKFILRFLLIALIASVASAFVFYLFVANDISASFNKAHIDLRNTWQIFLPALIVIGSLTFIISATISIFMMNRFSNKIAGPLYRLEQLTKEIASGNLDVQVKLREHDQVMPLAESFGTMAKGMSDRLYDIRTKVTELDNATSELTMIENGELKEGLNEAIKKVKKSQGLLITSLDSFKFRRN